MMENNYEISLCGLSLLIREGNKETVLEIPDYRTKKELDKIITETIKNYKNANSKHRI